MPLAACAAIFGFDDLVGDGDPSNPTLDGATAEDASDAGPAVDGGDPCKELGLPNAPNFTDAGGPDSMAPVHMAFKLFDFGITGVAPAGYNLDRTCSPTVATSSCAISESQATYEKYARDLDDKGTDNSGYGLLKYLAMLGPAFAPDSINMRLAAGEFGFVVRLIDWNGQPDDPEVFVELFPTVGVAQDPTAADPAPGGTPKFDPTDDWLRDRRFQKVMAVDASSLRSTRAFVEGGKLVAAYSQVTLPISVPDDPKPLDIIIQEGFLVGDLVADGAGWKLNAGIVAGRWRTSDILDQVRQIFIKDTLNLKNVVLCDPGNPTIVYESVKPEVCDGRDLRGASAEDNKGMPCDSVSAALRFDSYALTASGPFYTRPAIAARCVAAGSVPAGDNCDAGAP